MRIETIGELKHALMQHQDGMPLEVYDERGNMFSHAEWLIIDGTLRLTFVRTIETTAEETIAELNETFVLGAAT